ncbi:MAG TPA: hypothetical protein DER64_20455, partial [Planctomycetaceae bacterium]|nr:hypothetical protein [Planctomycetaceae bacterium]
GAKYPEQIEDRRIDPLQGRSLAPIFSGTTRDPHPSLYFHFGTDRALRQGPWKLVSAKRGRWELYNMDHDRTELNDLAAEQPERVATMAGQWFRLARNVDRLKGRQLAPVRNQITPLRFRKSTKSGAAATKKRKKKKRAKKNSNST